ncbi:MAG: metal ABC transporter solute-binding protein, Zn/Mn family [Saprospiraceae bacterium]
MKKIQILIFLFVIPLLLNATEKPKLVATASMISDIAQNIVGDKFEVTTIVPIGKDPHTYEPTPGDATKVAYADVIFKNDLTFEGWLLKLITNSGTKAKVVKVTEGVDVIESLTYANSADPHAWMNASNGIIYAENIKNAMVEYDAANKDFYEKNFEAYRKKLQELDQYIQDQIKTIPEQQRILITSHDAFQYYGRKYGIRLESILGTSTDAQAQTSDYTKVDKVIRESGVPAVFIESTVNPKMLQQLASSNDITIGGSLFSDSIGNKDSDAPSYLAMLKYNTDVIVKALSRKVEAKVAEAPEGKNNLLLYGILGVLFIGAFAFVYRSMNQ